MKGRADQPPSRPLRRELDEQELALWALLPTEDVFAELYNKLLAATRTFLHRRRGFRPEEAGEVAHQVLAESLMMLRRGTYDPRRADFVRCVYFLAARKRLNRPVGSPLPDDISGADSLYPPDILEKIEKLDAIGQCITIEGERYSLSELERRIFTMRILDDAKWREIADVLGMSIGRTERIYSRAAKKVRACMAAKGLLTVEAHDAREQ